MEGSGTVGVVVVVDVAIDFVLAVLAVAVEEEQHGVTVVLGLAKRVEVPNTGCRLMIVEVAVVE